ncbi:hypothetical protein [Rhodococcus coprophilus]|uniref:hypothetical protein n=1 Tax=Rhodococcus coprophilus TaxID=38310 RepID=UPI000A7A4AFD|nr:hypothetical protein [Rhodococcus coprophilus]MBM7458580.1 hypothetical protein [Rhodococcus coprophilus]
MCVERAGGVRLGQLPNYLGRFDGYAVVLELDARALEGADNGPGGRLTDPLALLTLGPASAAVATVVSVGGCSDLVPLRALVDGH